jgi:hypothetical protein
MAQQRSALPGPNQEGGTPLTSRARNVPAVTRGAPTNQQRTDDRDAFPGYIFRCMIIDSVDPASTEVGELLRRYFEELMRTTSLGDTARIPELRLFRRSRPTPGNPSDRPCRHRNPGRFRRDSPAGRRHR